MKILLVEPPKAPSTIGGEEVFLFESLALEYLAAGVSKEHEVRILDLRLDKDLQRLYTDFQPDIVGITAYTVHVNVVRRLFEQIKRWNPRVLTVVGGHHATVMPEDFLSPFIDLIVMGEGVFAFKEIVTRFERGEAFDGIPGAGFAKGGRLTRTDGQASVDLDVFPFPDRRLTARYRKHYYSEWMKPLASLRTSKGCPYRCKFCAQWKLVGGRYVKREPRRVVEELGGIEEEYVFFADDESLIDAPRMTRLAQLIKEAGIKKRYFLYGRSDTITRNPELLRIWRDIGLERVFVGLEFFRDADLNYIRKNSTSQDNENAVRILHGLGIDVYASFIVRPEFTKADFAALRKYCHRLELNFASFAVLTPLPGTDLHEEVRDQLITHNYDYFDFIHTLLPTALPLKDFYTEYHDLYTKGIGLSKQLSLLRKYPLWEISHLLAKGRRFYNRLKTAYLDYEN
jgi:radical SAM superfamily enzyme YgiQ (UPF0313 family)